MALFRKLAQCSRRTVGLDGVLEETLRRSSFQAPAYGRAIFIYIAQKLGCLSVDRHRRTMAIDDEHVTSVSDEVGEFLCEIAHSCVIITCDPDIGFKKREAAGPTDKTARNLNRVIRWLLSFVAGFEI